MGWIIPKGARKHSQLLMNSSRLQAAMILEALSDLSNGDDGSINWKQPKLVEVYMASVESLLLVCQSASSNILQTASKRMTKWRLSEEYKAPKILNFRMNVRLYQSFDARNSEVSAPFVTSQTTSGDPAASAGHWEWKLVLCCVLE